MSVVFPAYLPLVVYTPGDNTTGKDLQSGLFVGNSVDIIKCEPTPLHPEDLATRNLAEMKCDQSISLSLTSLSRGDQSN